MDSLADFQPAVKTQISGCTAAQFEALERQRAERVAPPEAISQEEFAERASFYPLKTLRLAATRYTAHRGRTYAQVMDGLVKAIQNPHTNCGDDFRIALGHVEATWRRQNRGGV